MSAGPGGETSSPKDCAVCAHSGKVSQCPGCGGLLGYKQWPPCTVCHGVIGVEDPPPPTPINPGIEITEPAALPQQVALKTTPTRDQFADVVRQLDELTGELDLELSELRAITRRAKRMMGDAV